MSLERSDAVESKLRELLGKTKVGKATVKYLKEQQGKVTVWATPYVKYDRINKATGVSQVRSIYGVTIDKKTVYISKELNKNIITFAATLVHEVEHTKGIEEFGARKVEILFYSQLEEAGFQNAMYKGYIDDGVVTRKDNKWILNEKKLKDYLTSAGYGVKGFVNSKYRYGKKPDWLQLFKK